MGVHFMKTIDSNWKTFEKSGSINDYLNYVRSLNQNEISQGDLQNAHQDRRDSDKRTEYR